MERVRETSTVKILLTLYEYGDLYTEDLARKAGLSLRHTKRVLPGITREKLIEQYQRKNKNYYKLTERGEAIAWGLMNPDGLVDLYAKEETTRVEGIEPPLLSSFRKNILSLMNREQKAFEQIGKEKTIPPELGQEITRIKKEGRELDKEFRKRKTELQKEIGLVTVIPHPAAFRGLDSLEDLKTGVSFNEYQDFAKQADVLLNRISSLKETRNKLKLAIDGLTMLHKKGLIDEKTFKTKKSRYERKLKITENTMEKVKELLV